MRHVLLFAALLGAVACSSPPAGPRLGADVHFPPISGGGGLASCTADAPLTGNCTSGSHLALPAATQSTPGSLSAADKTKLDGLNANPESFFETAVLDMKSTGLTTLVPAVAGKHWRTYQLWMRVVTNSGLSVAAVVNIGVTAPTYTDMKNGFAIGGAYPGDATYPIPGDVTGGAGTGMATVDVGTTPIIVNRAVAASGTALTISWHIIGEYF